jgi:hypothetical protein
MRRPICFLSLICVCEPSLAHDYWSDGEPVPAWTKRWCCGPSDVHRLKPGAVHIMEDGYHVDGLEIVLPFSKAMPSPDGHYWAFFLEEDGPKAHVACFYAPVNGY